MFYFILEAFTHVTYKHKRGGHTVYLHTMELIQPHFFWLDLTVERRKLLRHTSQTQKKEEEWNSLIDFNLNVIRG